MKKKLHVLLADDDADDRFFFDKTLRELSLPVILSSVEDGEKLMHFLKENYQQLPDLLFLDLNMPRKNGSECLTEIKADEKLKGLPVIIYSTSLHDDVADHLYRNCAHYYIRKTDLSELKKTLNYILGLMLENKFVRPGRDKFVLGMVEA